MRGIDIRRFEPRRVCVNYGWDSRSNVNNSPLTKKIIVHTKTTKWSYVGFHTRVTTFLTIITKATYTG